MSHQHNTRSYFVNKTQNTTYYFLSFLLVQSIYSPLTDLVLQYNLLTMLTVSNKEGGGKAPEEEKLNIPNFVRITNTSGFFIPASIINKAWTSLSYQIAKRNEAVVRTVDQNFLSYFLDHVLGFQPVPSVPVSTMTSYADTVYIANVVQNFTAGIIPGVLWQQTGYQALRTEKPIGEKEGFVDLRIWVEVIYSRAKTSNPFADNYRALRIRVCLEGTSSDLQTCPQPRISTLALHLAKLCGAQTSFIRE